MDIASYPGPLFSQGGGKAKGLHSLCRVSTEWAWLYVGLVRNGRGFSH